jgi:microsomal dipeptidase-like Zn-dependent dipeptidase
VIADLHAHYAMHLVPEAHRTVELLRTTRGRPRLRDRLRARIIGVLSRIANYESFHSGPRVTIGSMREGGVGALLSVLISPFDELDLDRPYGAPPESGYIESLLAQADVVERDLAENHASTAALVRGAAELEAVRSEGRIAFVHCVEGGFHLGPTPEAVDESVTRLARRGVAYVTLAHLFWRRVATNANAIPFIPNWLYTLLFPQPERGLSELGRAAVEAMVREHVLVDLSHMSAPAVEETLTLLDELDPGQTVPVIASHSGCRFGPQEYMLDERALRRIGARQGVVGLIFAEHKMLNGLRRKPPKGFDESLEVLCRHIDQIAEITGSHRNAAIGSDLDGFIKPTLAGLDTMADMKRLEAALIRRYGADDAELICSANTLRPLRAYWGAR